MTALDALRLVTARELRERGRSKAYLGGVAAVLVLFAAAILIPQLLSGGPVTYEIGVVGDGGEAVVETARAIAADQVPEDRELEFTATELADVDAARSALAAGDVEVVLVDGERILRAGAVGFGGSDAQDLLQQAAGIAQLQEQLAGTDLSVQDIAATLRGDPLPVEALEGAADDQVDTARSLIAYVGMFLLYMAVLLFGQWTLMGIVEEKSSRVVEVLLATLRPWQLLAGKILGIGLLGLAQFVVTVLWALLLISVTDVLELPTVPVDSAVALVVWFVLGYGLYATLNALVGSLVSRVEDAQSVAFPVSMVAIIGFLASFQALEDPSGTVAQVGTYIPFVAPFVVPIRVAFQEIAIIEQVAAAAVTVALTLVLVRVAGRLYAGGLLQFGGRLGLRQAWRSAEER